MTNTRTGLPLPGEEGFSRLSEEEQGWVQEVLPWYGFASTALHPLRALDHPMMATFAADKTRHLPMFVRFYGKHPVLFGATLERLTGHHTRLKDPKKAQSHWKTWLRSSLKIAA
jgi:hypothetical protein